MMTTDQTSTIARYVALRDRMARLQAAEDRCFVAYMNDPTPAKASSARKAKSRVNAISADLARATDDVFSIMDTMDDHAVAPDVAAALRQSDPDRFAQAVS